MLVPTMCVRSKSNQYNSQRVCVLRIVLVFKSAPAALECIENEHIQART